MALGDPQPLDPPLTAAEVDELAEGTPIVVTWSGGNGPHNYVIAVDQGCRYAWSPSLPAAMRRYNPLTFVGVERFHTRVWLRPSVAAPRGADCPPRPHPAIDCPADDIDEHGGPVDGPATERRLAWFSDAELAWELGRRRLAAEEAPDDVPARPCTCLGHRRRGEGSTDEDCPVHGREAELCRAVLDGTTWVNGEWAVPFRAYCHEPAGHPAGEVDGGHRNGSGDSW